MTLIVNRKEHYLVLVYRIVATPFHILYIRATSLLNISPVFLIDLIEFVYYLVLYIDNDDNQMTFVGHTVYLCPLLHHLHSSGAIILLGSQTNHMPSKSHVIVLLTPTSP